MRTNVRQTVVPNMGVYDHTCMYLFMKYIVIELFTFYDNLSTFKTNPPLGVGWLN